MATERQRAWGAGVHTREPWKPAKLTRAQREDIVRRLAQDEPPQALAVEYGVTARTIRRYRGYR